MSLDDILGKRGVGSSGNAKEALAEFMAELAEPDTYSPFLVRPSGQVSFLLIGADGSMHSFQYHALRQARFYTRGDEEFISLVADGLAVMIQGKALLAPFRALSRQVLVEMREYDGKPQGELATRITRLEVADPMDGEQPRRTMSLVK